MIMTGVYFLHRIKHTTDGRWDKGIEVKDQGTDRENLEAAKQAYHAYLGAYGYGYNALTDYVSCEITGMHNDRLFWETWEKPEVKPEPEPEPESESGGLTDE
jgi:hypothetical protein